MKPIEGVIHDEWKKYERYVIPRAAGAVQRKEMRRAFFAGWRSCLSTVSSGMSEGNDITTEDIDILEQIERELQSFAAAVKDGSA